jgi:hypothetical protein
MIIPCCFHHAMAIHIQELYKLFKARRIVFKLIVIAIRIRDIEYQVANINSKIFNIFIYIQLFFERTIYASFNDLKSRSKSLIELYDTAKEKRGDLSRGFGIDEIKVSAYIITLFLSLVFSNLYALI